MSLASKRKKAPECWPSLPFHALDRWMGSPCCAFSVRIQLLLCPLTIQPASKVTKLDNSSQLQPQLAKLDKMFRPRTQEFVQEHTFYMWINMWTWAYAWTTQTTKYSKANIYFTDWHRLKNWKSLPYNYPKALLLQSRILASDKQFKCFTFYALGWRGKYSVQIKSPQTHPPPNGHFKAIWNFGVGLGHSKVVFRLHFFWRLTMYFPM